MLRNKWLGTFSNLDLLSKLLLVGGANAALALFLTLPFLSMHLLQIDGVSAIEVGILLSLPHLITAFISPLAGWLADKIGPGKICLLSIFGTALSFAGYALVNSLIGFAFFIVVGGLFRSLYLPAAMSLLSQHTKQEHKMDVFKMRHIFNNLGYAFGPLLGGTFFIVDANICFLSTASIYLLFALVLLKVLSTKVNAETNTPPALSSTPSLFESISVTLKDRAMLLHMSCGMLVAFAGSQLMSTFAIFMSQRGSDGVSLYTWALTMNTVLAIVLQAIYKSKENLSTELSLALGCGLFGSGYILLAFVDIHIALMLFGVLMLTFGEVLIAPNQSSLTDQLAGPQMKGMYFGAFQLSFLGRFIGPIVGGITLEYFSGVVALEVAGTVSLLAGGLYYFAARSRVMSANLVDLQD